MTSQPPSFHLASLPLPHGGRWATGRCWWDTHWPLTTASPHSLALRLPQPPASSPSLLGPSIWGRRRGNTPPLCSRPFSFLPGTPVPVIGCPKRSHEEVNGARGPLTLACRPDSPRPPRTSRQGDPQVGLSAPMSHSLGNPLPPPSPTAVVGRGFSVHAALTSAALCSQRPSWRQRRPWPHGRRRPCSLGAPWPAGARAPMHGCLQPERTQCRLRAPLPLNVPPVAHHRHVHTLCAFVLVPCEIFPIVQSPLHTHDGLPLPGLPSPSVCPGD